MSDLTSGAGADTTQAAPGQQAEGLPVTSSLLTDGQAPAAQQAGTESQDEGQGGTEDKGASDGAGKTPPEGAPEAYEDFTAPEGVTLDTEVLEEFKGLAKELGLSQDKAQKVADILGKQTQAAAVAQTNEIQRVNTGWIEETKADPEIGGEKLAANLAAAKAAMEATTTPQLRMLLERTGLGNNAEVIRHFLKIAPAFAEDKHVPGGNRPPGSGKSAAQVLYDATPS